VTLVDGARFSTDVTVRFAETDAQGVVHNANYLIWFEVARVAYLAEYAGGYSSIREQGIESFVLESHIRYRQPAHFDDRLRVHTRVRGGARCALSLRLRDHARGRGDRRRVDLTRLRRCEDIQADPDPTGSRGRDR